MLPRLWISMFLLVACVAATNLREGRDLESYRRRTSNCDYVIDAFEDWFDCCVEDYDRRRLEDSPTTTDTTDTDKSKSSSTPKSSSTSDASRDDGRRKKRSRRYKKSTRTGSRRRRRRRSVKCNDPDYDDDDVYFAIKDCDFDDLVDALE
ncbi:hypothetical protein ACHAXS_010705 [Conticribra weissflogii]